MGNNYRFKLSDIIPNAWFYKLRDLGRAKNQTSTTQSRKNKQPSSTPTSSSTKHSSKPKQQPHQFNIPRKSYYFTSDDRIINNTSPSPKNQKMLNTNNFHEPPRKSTKQSRAKRRVSRTCSSPKYNSLELHDPEFRTDSVLLPNESLLSFDKMVSFSNNYSSSCGCRVLHSNNNNTNDVIIIDVDNNSIARRKDEKLEGYDDSISHYLPPPILTKPSSTKFNDELKSDENHDDDVSKNNKKKETKPRSRMVRHKIQQKKFKVEFDRRMDDLESGPMTLDQSDGSRCVVSSNEVNVCKSDRRESDSIKGSLKVKIVKQDNASMKELSNTPSGGGGRRLRLRINSPRIRCRKSLSPAAGGRRSLSDSFAIVKSSFNPRRDFRESMVEMIVQNNIRSSKGLEDLLACYLSLNSDEYHDLIINVFKQIWFDLTNNQ
ncbi:hypothetical protein RIF29_00212 [Crotalaria pallida]|uniref:Transcription repressor n=1 Tax=Crotalaria pallida TaxID=3830 RepID=A0AAN9IWB3_CROPI